MAKGRKNLYVPRSIDEATRRALYLASKKRDYEKHKEARLAQQREKRYGTPEAIERIRQYRREHYRENSAKIKAKVKKYREENPEVKAAAQDRRRTRATVSMDKIDRLLSVEYRKCIKGNPCHYCGAPGTQTDHYYPLAKGGTDHWFNLVRACSSCNNRKSTSCGTRYLLRK